jgi:hypothetical protein
VLGEDSDVGPELSDKERGQQECEAFEHIGCHGKEYTAAAEKQLFPPLPTAPAGRARRHQFKEFRRGISSAIQYEYGMFFGSAAG